MRLLLITLALSIPLASCSVPSLLSAKPKNVHRSEQAAEKTSETKRLNHWLALRYEEELQMSPMEMTYLGRKDHYGEIEHFTEAAEDRILQWRENTVADLKHSFNYSKLTSQAKVSYDIWLYQYKSNKAMSQYRRHRYLFTQKQGAHIYLPNFMINFHKVDDQSDMQAVDSTGRCNTGIKSISRRFIIQGFSGPLV